MSSVEERLRHDIEAVTKGVVVTETELWDAQNAVDERVAIKSRRDRSRTVLLVAAAVVVIAGVGLGAFQAIGGDDQEITPAGSGPSADVFADFLKGDSPTPELLNGFWRVDNGVTMVHFQTDGTVQFADQGTVISDPVTTGTYTIDGDTISVTTSDAPRCVTPEFTMRASLPKPGLVNVVLADTHVGTCGTVASTIALEQVVPIGPSLAGLKSSGETGWQSVTETKVLYGDWMAEGGGYLLELTEDGSYYVVDDSTEVVDSGLWRFRGSKLELASRAESPQCSDGDTLVFGNLEQLDGGGTTPIRGTTESNDCGGGWTPTSWIRLPDASSSDTSN